MKKYLIYALGALVLLSGCSQDKFFENDMESRSVSQLLPGNLPAGKGIPGTVYVKVQNTLRDEIQKISLYGNISLNSAPSSLATTLRSIKANHIERLFPADPRFEKRKHREGLDSWYIINFDKKQDLEQTLATLAANPQFEIVEKAYAAEVPLQKAVFSTSPATRSTGEMPFDDPLLNRQWHYKNFGTTPKSVAEADINLFEAWQTTTGTSNVIVSVVDGGIDITHEDLIDNLWVNPNEIPDNDIDDDGNGFVDDVNGFNFYANKGKITLDDAGHGTHVAGTVAARNNNGIGVGGVAGGDGSPDSGARLMSCQIFEDNKSGGNERATVYGADNGAVISQNSWGFTYPGPTQMPASIRAAIDYFIKYAGCDNDGNQLPDSPMKGGVVIYAAGNDDKDYLCYPSAYPPVIAVSGMAPNWKKAWYTNRGDWVDIMAPGGDQFFAAGEVYSTVPAAIYKGEQYGYMQGTSMACPHVSGIAALVVSKFGKQGFTNEELKERLLYSLRPENIDEHNPDYKGRLGLGYIDAALTFAENKNIAPEDITDLKAESNFTEMTLSWKAVKDGDDGTPVKYLLYFSDKNLTAGNYKSTAPEVISASGFKPGDIISYSMQRLQENTTYYAAVIAMDRWKLESKFTASEFKTRKNDPPTIKGIPQEIIRVNGSDIQRFTLKVNDPNGHKVSYKMGGETRGVSAGTLPKEGGDLNFAIRAVAPIGIHEIEITVTDELGAGISAKIPFEVFSYEPPVASKTIQNLFIGTDQAAQEIDLNEHFTYQQTPDLAIDAKSSDSSIASVTVNGAKLAVKGNKAGEATVNVTLSDGKETAKSSFKVRVVTNSKDMVYQVYPIPATTELNVLVNPEVKRADFTIRSVNGERVFQKSYNIGSSNSVKLNIRELSAGVYTLTVNGAKGNYKKTFVKQ